MSNSTLNILNDSLIFNYYNFTQLSLHIFIKKLSSMIITTYKIPIVINIYYYTIKLHFKFKFTESLIILLQNEI